jgi:hypothetical protein
MPDKSNMMEGWYWSRGGQQLGPYSWEQLCQFAREGRIQPADQIWHVGWDNWSAASQVPGLFGIVRTAPDRSSAKRTTKHARLTLPHLLAGAIISASLILIILVALVVLRPPETARPSETPIAAQPVATPVAAQPSGVLSVDASGGHFENDEIALAIPPGSASSKIDLTLSRRDPEPTLPEDVTYQSALYNLTGPLHLLSGEIQINFTLPDEVLQSGTSDEEEYVVVLEEEVVTPSTGPVIDHTRLPTQVDRSAHLVRAVLTLPQADAALGHSPALVSLVIPRQAIQEDMPPTTIGLRLERGWLSDSLANDHFRVTFPHKRVSPEAVAQLLATLEDQKQKIESLGLTFNARTAWPIEVELENWGTQGGTQRYGLFVPSRWGVNGCKLQFNRAYLRTVDAFQEERREIQATAGHELFHLVQFLYGPQTSFSKATGVFGRPFFWLEEATSTWFEPMAVADPGYLPAIAKDNIAFIHTPLYFPESDNAQGHGYGASLFLRYLTQKYGPQLIGEIWRWASDKNYSKTGAEALNEALHTYNNLESSVSLEWPSFLERYLTQPTQLAADLDVTGLTSKAAVLKAEAVAEQDDVKISFLQNLAEHKAEVTDGWLKAASAATLKLQFSLKALSADAFRISFRSDPATQQALSAPGQMRISVDSPEWSGVLVYGMPRESPGEVVPIAGAPWNFMSSGDSAAGQGAQLVVDGLSHREGTGNFTGLLLIPFNYSGSNYTKRDANAAVIKIELAFQPAPPTPTPTPTVEPAQPADNPCAGLTPDDILHPGLNSKKILCRQRCVPIGGPTPTYEQLLACINGGGGHGGP